MGNMLKRSAVLGLLSTCAYHVLTMLQVLGASSVDVPPDLSLRLSESRAANLDAALRFERSLTAEQRAIRDELTKTYVAFQAADQAVQQFCVKAGMLASPGRAACLEKPSEPDAKSGR